MRYLVTGATGFLGGALARRLAADGHQVQALVRARAPAGALSPLGVTLFTGDITDPKSIRPAMEGVDGVFHVAGWYKLGTRDQRDGVRVNVEGTRNVLALMKELRIPKGVYTSTLAVNSDTRGKLADESYRFTGRHLTEYDRTKALAHDIAREYIAGGLPLVIVMPGLIYGPGDTSASGAAIIGFLKGRLPAVPAGGKVTWAHVEDVAQGHILAMQKGAVGETYMICGEPYGLAEAYDLAAELTGRKPPAKLPPGLVRFVSGLMSAAGKIIPLPEAYSGESLRVAAGVTYLGDNSKARHALGYDPRPLREGLKQTLDHEMRALGMK